MLNFLALCGHLKTCLTELQCTDGGSVSILVSDCPRHFFPADGRTWTPWVVDAPAPFLARMIDAHLPLKRAVGTLRQVRNHPLTSGTSAYREAFRHYFDGVILKTNWIGGSGIAYVQQWARPREDDPNEPCFADEWRLALVEAPTERLNWLIELAEKVTLEDERNRRALDELAEAEPQSTDEEEVFVPTPVQAAILKALVGRALRTGGLEEATKVDHSQMFRGMKKLKELGRVKRHSKLGFYRPDTPPPSLTIASERHRRATK